MYQILVNQNLHQKMKTSTISTLLVLICCTILAGCKSKDDIRTDFKITTLEVKENVDTTLGQSLETKLNKYLSDGYIKFQDNDTVTVFSRTGSFLFGQWSQDDKTDMITLDIKELGPISFKKEIQLDEKDNLEFLILKGKNAKGAEVKLLLKKDDHFEYNSNDLLSLDRNRWRIKPLKKESKEQIKIRTLAQIDYMISYFELVVGRDLSYFNRNILVSPYAFYQDGIGIEPSELSEYNQIFYDDNDAAEALDLLRKGIRSISRYPTSKDSYTEGYLNVLKEIRKYIALL